MSKLRVSYTICNNNKNKTKTKVEKNLFFLLPNIWVSIVGVAGLMLMGKFCKIIPFD